MTRRTALQPRPSARDRLADLAWFLGFLLVGLLMLWLGLHDFIRAMQAMGRRSPLIAFQPRYAIAFGPALIFLALAAMTVVLWTGGVPDSTQTQRRPRLKGWKNRTILALFGVALAAMVLTFVTSPVEQMIVGQMMSRRGYVRCSVRDPFDRHEPMRWALPGTDCP